MRKKLRQTPTRKLRISQTPMTTRKQLHSIVKRGQKPTDVSYRKDILKNDLTSFRNTIYSHFRNSLEFVNY